MLMRYAASAALVVGLGAAGWGLWSSLQAEQDRNADLGRQLEAARIEASEARRARAIEATRAAEARELAAEAQSAVEDVLSASTGECADAPLDPALRRAIERVRPPLPRPSADSRPPRRPGGDADAVRR